jgi:hypothetical protein
LHAISRRGRCCCFSPRISSSSLFTFVLFAYGVILPVLNRFAPFATIFRRLRLVIPPSALALGFILGSFLAFSILMALEEINWG